MVAGSARASLTPVEYTYFWPPLIKIRRKKVPTYWEAGCEYYSGVRKPPESVD